MLWHRCVVFSETQLGVNAYPPNPARPVLIYVAPDVESTVSPLLQTERSNVAYVVTEVLCHPLAVKVCQE
jgi:hypothetical protein